MFVIAGVTGHTGSVVATALLAKKQKVKVIVRDAAKGAAWSQKGAEVAVGNLDDANFMATALKGAAGFFTLLPPNYTAGSAEEFYSWQRKVADGVAAAVKQAHVAHVVLLSSIGADLAAGNGPIKGLHHFENALRASGTKLTAIRAGYFQENTGNVVGAAKQAGIFPNFFGSPDHATPMIATVDIAHLAVESLLAPPAKSEVVDLYGPSYSVRQVAEKLGKAIGKTLQIVDVPQAGWVPAMMQGGMPQHLAEIFAEMYAGFGTGAIAPKGDRSAQGKTEIDAFISTLAG